VSESDYAEITRRLDELGEEFGSELTSQLLDTFLLDNTSRLNNLRQLIEQKDAPAFARMGHALKGNFGNLGAIRLANLSAQLEGRDRECSLDRAQAILVELEESMTVIQPGLNQWLPAHMA
jgi:HPt (histidine-containing phosphotransfer) domain-containing protein